MEWRLWQGQLYLLYSITIQNQGLTIDSKGLSDGRESFYRCCVHLQMRQISTKWNIGINLCEKIG